MLLPFVCPLDLMNVTPGMYSEKSVMEFSYDAEAEVLMPEAAIAALDRLLEEAKEGIPAMRPDFWEAGSIQESRDPYAYFLGDDLFVCPVIEKGKTWRRVHLPAGKWIGLWDGKTHYGPLSFTAQAPLGKIPVFYRAGSEFTEVFRAAAETGDVPQSRKKR